MLGIERDGCSSDIVIGLIEALGANDDARHHVPMREPRKRDLSDRYAFCFGDTAHCLDAVITARSRSTGGKSKVVRRLPSFAFT